MKITVLQTRNDGKSYFSEEDIETPIAHPLGSYSNPFASNSIQFRSFSAGLLYPMHNAPQIQYIIYLEGKVEVSASGGETKVFKPGNVLLVKDTEGEGHETKTLSSGKSLIIPAHDNSII